MLEQTARKAGTGSSSRETAALNSPLPVPPSPDGARERTDSSPRTASKPSPGLLVPGKTLDELERALFAPAAESRGAIRAAARRGPSTRFGAASKRGLDLVLAALLLLLAAPLILVVAIAVKVESPGPVLFRQPRLGKHLRPFSVLKFRTMTLDVSPQLHQDLIAELAVDGSARGPGLKKLVDDPRVTGLGCLLRRVSIDELPQLFNVLVGDMSLVGPRPALDYEIEHYTASHFDRFAVRPGLTGLWQVSGRSELGFIEMLDLDAEYARNATLLTDLRILALTPRATVGRTA